LKTQLLLFISVLSLSFSAAAGLDEDSNINKPEATMQSWVAAKRSFMERSSRQKLELIDKVSRGEIEGLVMSPITALNRLSFLDKKMVERVMEQLQTQVSGVNPAFIRVSFSRTAHDGDVWTMQIYRYHQGRRKDDLIAIFQNYRGRLEKIATPQEANGSLDI
jgi:hypothetical protein